jgi:hypothetical protein
MRYSVSLYHKLGLVCIYLHYVVVLVCLPSRIMIIMSLFGEMNAIEKAWYCMKTYKHDSHL